ncbi:hypothetical protein BU26DRAFT_500036 [Trematosphaeria pertusa]|uniref:Uncharacterized protein n=1 Tax=Trematosphaeria pertusa TaxID=390896 RepID=A0A6A6IV32_9PLEO|nr:uncharacterized protein BU26DRAFT_500036 [Trematosphaeria pertusa]KAF2254246.1 hypothetical protein BU26DRAFT_500036 [Trematosphaeria pertusa]
MSSVPRIVRRHWFFFSLRKATDTGLCCPSQGAGIERVYPPLPGLGRMRRIQRRTSPPASTPLTTRKASFRAGQGKHQGAAVSSAIAGERYNQGVTVNEDPPRGAALKLLLFGSQVLQVGSAKIGGPSLVLQPKDAANTGMEEMDQTRRCVAKAHATERGA